MKIMAVLGMFGMVPFVCSDSVMLTFRDLKVSKSSKFASHEVFGKKPVLEYTGESSDSVSMTVRFDSQFGFPPAVGLTLLNKLRMQHIAYSLIIGGEYFGKFVIEQVNENRKFFNGFGVGLIAEAEIQLIEVSNDR